MYLFTFEKHKNLFHVHSTDHISETRKAEHHSRNKNYTNEKLHEILNIAVGSMTQYRNKKQIAITFFNDFGKTNAILCSLEDDKIFLITMLENVKRQVNDVFRGCEHIFLREYIFTKPDYEDIQDIDIKIVKYKPTKQRPGLSIKKKKGKKLASCIVKNADDTLDDLEFLKSIKSCDRLMFD